MRFKIHQNDNILEIRNKKLKQATLNSHALLYRQALEQKAFPDKPVVCAYFNDGQYHVNLMGDRSALLHLLFGTVTAILKDSPPREAMNFYEYMLNAVTQVNIEKCCETMFGGTEPEDINVEFADGLLDYLANHHSKENRDAKDSVSDAD